MSPPLPPWLRTVNGGVELDVVVQPRASRTRVVGEHDGRLKLQLAAPPVDGEANAALVEFLADSASVSRSNVVLLRGETGRRKTLLVRTTDAGTLHDTLLPRGTP